MSMSRDPVCIACGQATGPRPRLNRLPDGRTCPRCRDRLLDTLPALLPASRAQLPIQDWAEEADDGEDDFLKGA